MAKLTPMMQQYLDLKQEYDDCILMFRLGDFYEMFFEDAVTASKELEIALTGRDCGLEERAPMCGVPHHSVENYINKLIQNGRKVAICDQLEDPSVAKGIVKRGVTRVITPGTVVELSMLSEAENNYILSVAFAEHEIGIAYCDVSTGEFALLALENEVQLQNEIARLAPKEMIVADAQARRMLQLMQSSRNKSIFVNPCADWSYGRESAYKALTEHFNREKELIKAQPEISVSAAGALMTYLKATQKNALLHISHIARPEDDQYMALDSSTRKNLELTQTLMDGSKRGSLLWLLDKTKTAMGARLLKKYLLQPLKRKAMIEERLQAVAHLKDDLYLRNSLTDYFGGIFDLERIISRISYQTIDAKDCLSLKNSIQALPYVKELLSGIDLPLMKQLQNQLDDLADVYTLLDEAIDEDAGNSITEGGIIRRGYDAQIDALIDASRNGKQWLAQLEAKEKEETGIKNLKIGYNKVFGYFIEVTKSNLAQVPYRYTRKQTLANCERYITQELKEMEETILNAETKRGAMEYEVFCKIRGVLANAITRIQGCAQAVATLDVLRSFAQVAYEYDYVCPEITEDGAIEIQDGRHPVVEKLTKAFVPNDAMLDQSTHNMLLITGPNMAGKSTYMRQVGLITLLAHVGCFVPASSAKICMVDRIFTRVGASDDLASGQSTFMVEMNELANILNFATSKSLLILDEIGRGTSTIDGLSIAWSSAEYILSTIKAKTLFATHYHELVELEHMLSGIQNYSVAAKEVGSDIVFLHKIIPGGTDKSFGIEVAKLAGLPKAVVSRAKEFLNTLQNYEISLTTRAEAPDTGQSTASAELPLCVQEIATLNLDVLTPIEALNLLHKLKKELQS